MNSETDAPELEATERFRGHAYTFSHEPDDHPGKPPAAVRSLCGDTK
ncbi:MAG: hypothetical protein ACRDOI_37095 [Trebonia sp.]